MGILATPLIAESFVRFGEVVSVGEPGERLDYAAKLHNGRLTARANLVTVRCVPVALPLKLKLLEKHPHSSQTFIPMICSRYLICVAPTGPDGTPRLSELAAFIGLGGQAINYHPGTWHHPLVVLDLPAQFAMLVWEDGGPEDCLVFPLVDPPIVNA